MKIILVVIGFMLSACGGQYSDATRQKTALEALYQQHMNWKGTPYLLGGNNKKGIDCSGFVSLSFNQLFGHQLPRTTLKQSAQGQLVLKGDLQTADLLFFNINKKSKVRHVGIYLENGLFLHASTQKGVMISDLSEAYWKNTYWKAKRVKPLD